MRLEKFTVTEITNPQELMVLECENAEWDICVSCKKWDMCILKDSRFPGYYPMIKNDVKKLFEWIKIKIKNRRLKKAIRRIKFDAELKHVGSK